MGHIPIPLIEPSPKEFAEARKKAEVAEIKMRWQSYKDSDFFSKTIKQYAEEVTASLKSNEKLVIAMTLKNGQTIYPDPAGFECIDENFFLVHGVDQNKNRITLLTCKKDIQLLFDVEKKSVEQPRKQYASTL
jgi:hypothetical protein